MAGVDGFRHGIVDLLPLTEEYLRETLSWRNADDVRIWFKSKNVIAWETHLIWYRNYCGIATDQVFLARNVLSGELIGQLSVYNIKYSAGTAEIGRFIAAPNARGRGLMRLACIALIEYCRIMLHLSNLYLEVLWNNARAIALYNSLGFETSSEDGGVVRMELHIGEKNV